MDYKDKNITIGEVVAALPEATQIFKTVGIDYCCGGHRLLADVIQQQHIDQSQLYLELGQAQQKRKSGYKNDNEDFTKMSPEALSAYIEDTHHAYLRKELPEAMDLLSTILRVHGNNHRELFDVYKLFGQLKSDLEQHLLKEETIVFPELGQHNENLNTLIELTTEIINEHEAAGELLRKLRQLTQDYQAPTDGCATFQKTYALLEQIEQDLHQHIHLENNILLKKYQNRLTDTKEGKTV
jgi:regulator of cell morphogenesis and NO signaling